MNRAVRAPPGSRRNLSSQPKRRQPPTTVRSDLETTVTLQQSQEGELVERSEEGEYVLYAPTGYKHLAMNSSNKGEEEDEQELQIIGLYGKQNPQWDQEAYEEELKAALKTSLEKKVASVDEDNWMFQSELEGGKK